MHAQEYMSRRKRKRKQERTNSKKMAKTENEKNVYRNGGLGHCLPHRVSTSAI